MRDRDRFKKQFALGSEVKIRPRAYSIYAQLMLMALAILWRTSFYMRVEESGL